MQRTDWLGNPDKKRSWYTTHEKLVILTNLVSMGRQYPHYLLWRYIRFLRNWHRGHSEHSNF